MDIFVDADAFANVLKDILLRFVLKRVITTKFVANKKIALPSVEFISMHIAPQGVDEADNFIAATCKAGDLVITADIPLADRIVNKGAIGLDPRGTLYTQENIKSILAMRNLMQELRDGGEITGGPKAIGEKEKRAFANALNALLQKL
ncbi:MAG: DUF188 domain-containing protein [Sulfurospirillum sp.]|nr:DUF188 domain-containing protein [Sulfurospirillum sp.]